jgi:hypothetical protein
MIVLWGLGGTEEEGEQPDPLGGSEQLTWMISDL